MRGITEERLKEIKEKMPDGKSKLFVHALITQCTELNAWHPIETAPLGIPILIVFENGLYEVGELSVNRVWKCNVGIDYDYECEPIYWQELPEYPK